MAIGNPEPSRDPSRPAQKWLGLDGVPEQRWRLSDDANLDMLEAHIKAAMRSGEAVTVEVRSDCPPFQSRIVLNGRALAFVVLFETGA